MEKKNAHKILINRFTKSVMNFPGRSAIEIKGKSYTYSYVEKISNAIANCISINSDKEMRMAAVLGQKAFETYAGILGVLKSSKAYVPLNPRFPLARTITMIETSNVDTIVVCHENLAYLRDILLSVERPLNIILPGHDNDEGLVSSFPECRFFLKNDLNKKENLIIDSSAEDIAYLLFTSGSTGKPKAVAVSNSNVASYLDFISQNYKLTEYDRFSQTFDLTFDLSVHDMFVCWQSGGCLVIPENDSSLFMSKYIRKNNISVWFSVPSLAVMMAKMRLLKENSFPSVKYSFFCGEAFYMNTALSWQKAASKSKVINLYGPSEATIAISLCELKKKNNPEKNGMFSIGKVFPSQDYCIINKEENVPKYGEKGELCLSGSQVINGYFNDKENTDRSFVRIPAKAEKLWYRTGDVVIEENGNLFFLGRSDSEVKVKGFRVNLLEIDHVLMKYVKSESVASISFGDETDGVNKLFSFVCLPEKSTVMESEIIGKCKEKLPWYMIPDKVFIVEEMPLNNNGKIDKKKIIEKYLK